MASTGTTQIELEQRKRRVLTALGDSRRNVAELAQTLDLTTDQTKTALRRLANDGLVRMTGGMWETIEESRPS